MPNDNHVDDTRHASRARSRALVLAELSRSTTLTPPQLVELTGLSRATVASVLAELADEGHLVRHGRARTARGRPPVLVSLRQSTEHLVSVDIGHTHLGVALAGADGHILAETRTTMDGDLSGGETIAAAARTVSELMADRDVARVAVVALGVPGPLHHAADGTVRSGGVMQGWADLQPAAVFRAELGREVLVTVDNDAHLGAIGEHAFGAARGHDVALYVKVAAGIGSGVMVNNALYRGGNGAAGEIGHVRVVDHGDLCRCGSRGCLETVASLEFALRSLQRLHGSDLTMADVLDLLRRGDPGAVGLFEDIGTALGEVLANTVSALDPKLIVIGSPFVEESALTAAVRRALTRGTQPFVAAHNTVVPGQLGERAALLGGIARARRMAAVRRDT